MSLKIIAIVSVVLLVLIGAGGYLDHTLSYKAGAASRDKACATDRAADRATYLQAQTDAVSKAGEAQAQADKHQLDDLKSQLAVAQQESLTSQHTSDQATAKADQLTAEMKRLRHESPDVESWNDACLPAALLASLHPSSDGKANPSPCR